MADTNDFIDKLRKKFGIYTNKNRLQELAGIKQQTPAEKAITDSENSKFRKALDEAEKARRARQTELGTAKRVAEYKREAAAHGINRTNPVTSYDPYTLKPTTSQKRPYNKPMPAKSSSEHVNEGKPIGPFPMENISVHTWHRINEHLESQPLQDLVDKHGQAHVWLNNTWPIEDNCFYIQVLNFDKYLGTMRLEQKATSTKRFMDISQRLKNNATYFKDSQIAPETLNFTNLGTPPRRPSSFDVDNHLIYNILYSPTLKLIKEDHLTMPSYGYVSAELKKNMIHMFTEADRIEQAHNVLEGAVTRYMIKIKLVAGGLAPDTVQCSYIKSTT